MSFNTNHEEEGKNTMNNAQTFIREMADAEADKPVYFNEYKSSDHWWHHRRKKERLANVALFLSLVIAAAAYYAIATGTV